MRRLLPFLALLVAAPASAAVDWAAGRVIAQAVGAADLRLPSVGIARVAAERMATARAAERLRDLVRGLPVAGGTTVGKAADADATLGTALDALLVATEPVLEYQSDGSVVARTEIALALVSALVAGEPAPPPIADDAPPPLVVVVAAPGTRLTRAVGYRLEVGATTRWAPVYFIPSLEDDARGRGAHVDARATSVKKGTLTLSTDEKAIAGASEVVVLVVMGKED